MKPYRTAATLGVIGVLVLAPPPHPSEAQEQRYWDWSELDFAPEEYQARRDRLLTELGRLADPVLLVPSAQGVSHGPTFRQLDDFHYLTGLELPSSVLVLDPREGRAVVYAPGRDARFENPGRVNDFPGRPLADDPSVQARSGVIIRDLSEFDARLSELVSAGRNLMVNLESATAEPAEVALSPTPDLSPGELLVLHLRETYPDPRVHNGFRPVARVRAVKSDAEIGIIRRVARITEDAIRRAAEHVGPGVDERTLQGWFELGCREGGAQAIPFHPIIKSGPNSLWAWRVLASHYDRRNRVMEGGDLVVFDVGCELDHYVSDVGRTFPVSGTFSPAQAEALTMQRAVADAIIAAIRPGVTLAEATEAGRRAIPPEARPYMQTGSFYSHHLGLSTGDPVLTDEPLQAGMVFTVEPWYYNHETRISVFVEDMILVTEDGAEVLTSTLPRDAEALSGMVGAPAVSAGAPAGPGMTRLFELPETRLYPESIAHDPRTGDYFLGSLGESRILRIRPDGSYEDFVRDLGPDLESGVGLKVDPDRRRLWIATGHFTLFTGDRSGPDRTGVSLFDLDSGELLGRWQLDQPSPFHIFNDLAVAADGSVYATTTLFNRIYRIRADSEDLELVHEQPDANTNGITLSPDGRYLFASMGRTIQRLDLESGDLLDLPVPDDADEGTDGLYLHDGALIVVQPRLNRVIRLRLNPAMNEVQRVEIVAADHPDFVYPTTGVLVGDDLVLVSTSYANLAPVDGVVQEHPPVVISRIPLTAR
jgi:Xaa-Pro aminopeptidase